MGRSRLIALWAVLAVAVLLVVAGVASLVDREWIKAARDAAVCLGIVSAALTGVQFLHKTAFDRTQLALKLMREFYEDDRLEEVRRALRNGTSLQPQVYAHPGGSTTDCLRPDEVRVMNYFEAIAIAVQRGALDVGLVNKMLGKPMTEVEDHPDMKRFVRNRGNDTYDYEVFAGVLLPRIHKLRGLQ